MSTQPMVPEAVFPINMEGWSLCTRNEIALSMIIGGPFLIESCMDRFGDEIPETAWYYRAVQDEDPLHILSENISLYHLYNAPKNARCETLEDPMVYVTEDPLDPRRYRFWKPPE